IMVEAVLKCHCCVPQCTTNKQRKLCLSFHSFPSDLVEKKKWVVAIHVDEGSNFRIQPRRRLCGTGVLYTSIYGRRIKVKVGETPESCTGYLMGNLYSIIQLFITL
uniref:THAP-type domain-containing protein n=1 Tax=Sphaeramia orbicularis TaxID=375764 RepID=A0A672ZWC6_9TELE